MSIIMSSLSSVQRNSPEQLASSINNFSETSSSFQNRSFKVLYVASSYICSTVMGIYHSAMQFLSYIFNQDASASTHAQLAKYSFVKASSLFRAYDLFGDHLINFSVNTTAIPLEHSIDSQDKLTHLKSIYGDELEEHFNRVSSKDFSLDDLSPIPIDKGVCMGSSLDFIREYFSLRSKGNAVSDSIEKVSSSFVNSGTKNAQILQIIGNALFNSPKSKKALSDIKSAFEVQSDNAMKELQELRKEFHNKASKLSESEVDEAIETMQSAFEEYTANIIPESFNKVGLLQEKLFRSLNNASDLKVCFKKHIQASDGNTIDETGADSFQDLDSGVYFISISYHSRAKSDIARHAIVYIKETDEKGYFFDPNIGCISHTIKEDLKSQYETFSSNIYSSENKKTHFNIFSLSESK